MLDIPLFIDSGAFSAYTMGKPIDLGGYIEFIRGVIAKNPRIVYANLDVIGEGEQSYVNWRTMRDAGLNPVPVFSVNSDPKWLRRYLKKTEDVALGALIPLGSTAKKVVVLDRIWREHMPTGVRVHGMGVGDFTLMGRYDWYSVDGSGWNGYGNRRQILIPKLNKGTWDYTNTPLEMNLGVYGKDRNNNLIGLPPLCTDVIQRWVKENGFEVNELVKGNCNQCSILNAMVYDRFAHVRGIQFFFSGGTGVEDHMKLNPRLWRGGGVMVTYHTLQKSKTSAAARRLEKWLC